MPAFKRAAGTGDNQSIRRYFGTTEQRAPIVQGPDEDIYDEIIVAPHAAGIASTKTKPLLTPHDNLIDTPAKRGPGRPRKHPLAPSGESTESTPRRGPGRPRKHPPASPETDTPDSSHRIANVISFGGNPSSSSLSSPRSHALSPDSPHAEQQHGSEVANAEHQTSPHRRLPENVVIRSPNPKSDSAPFPVAMQNDRSIDAPNISFSSITSLSSNPLSAYSSSRRVVEGGLKGVTNSDSDSEDDSDDDNSSGEELPDVMALFAAKKRKLPSSTELESENTMRPSRQARTNVGAGSRLWPVVSPPHRKKYKYDLGKMAAKVRKQNQAEAQIASLETDAQKEDFIEAERDPDGLENGDLAIAAAAAGSDTDEQDRMLHALERTEAMQESHSFQFFRDSRPLYENQPFPLGSLPAEAWTKPLSSDSARQNAFLSGYVADMARRRSLGVNVTNWIARQLLYERREALCQSYLETLRACSQHEELSNTLAMLTCFYSTNSITENVRIETKVTETPEGLANIMQMMSFCAPASDRDQAVPTMTSTAFFDLALLLIDTQISKDPSLVLCAVDGIERMLATLSDESFEVLISEVATMFMQSTVLSVHHRCQLVASLPAGTSRTFAIRRRLALDLLAYTPRGPLPRTEASGWTDAVVNALQNRVEFQISESTDYVLLQKFTAVMDIAIGTSWLPDNHTEAMKGVDSERSSLFAARTTTTQAATRHNTQVDAVIAALEAVSGRIRGAGTAHLARTEAKSSIERLLVRLEHGVRTKPRPRRNVFERGSGPGSLTNFLQKSVTGAAGNNNSERPSAKVV